MLGTADEPGLVPRAVDAIFESMERHPTRMFIVYVSYMEVSAPSTGHSPCCFQVLYLQHRSCSFEGTHLVSVWPIST